MVPDNITKDHINAALAEIDQNGVQNGAHSSTYDLIHNGKRYPPKLVISLANKFANGEELPRDTFYGGPAHPGFKLLEKEGFEIVLKNEEEKIENVKEEFIAWFFKNTNGRYENLKDHIVRGDIKESEKYLDRSIFEVNESNYKELLEYLKKELYRKESAFVKYSASISHHRPRAILGKENYLKFLKEKFNSNLKKEEKYWIFQGSPEIYDIERALREGHLKTWKVAAHIDKIKIGDKVILWQTGQSAGCYALAEIISEVGNIQEEDYEKQYYKIADDTEKSLRVKLKITTNLVDNPVLWEGIKELPEFENFNAGNQGTNFSATKEEFETINDLVTSRITSSFASVKRILDQDKVEKFIGFLRNFVKEKNLDPQDPRIAFNVRFSKKRLVFLIGNRYVLNIEKVGSKTIVSFISPETLGAESGAFKNKKGEIEAYWNIVDSIDGYEEKIKEGFQIEMERNHKSPFKRFSDSEFIKEVFGRNIDIATEENMSNTNNDHSQISLNTILYGPPGTGKTYYSKELAVRIGNPDFLTQDIPTAEKRIKINEEYQRLFDLGQIVFTTFHQSFSYEDFVEGIKPLPPELDGGSISYSVQAGIFKNLCTSAKIPDQQNFDSAFESLIKELGTSEKIQEIKTPTGKNFGISLNSQNNLNLHTGREMKKQGTLTKENILKEIVGEDRYPYWQGYFQGVIDHLRREYNFKKEESAISKNYILIIDEINRGNISSIFGELITLLEADKRIGKAEEIKVELPYSKVSFGVPDNLYIIGTMNTADRSVEALDTALRRRFTFEEVMPEPELLRNIEFEGFNLGDVLGTLNNRIEALLDRDHTIGHSYFMNIESGNKSALKQAFENKIIPLLQEYFYHDYDKIALILGEGFIKYKQSTLNFANVKNLEKPELNDSFELKKIDDIEDAIMILLNNKDEE